MSNLDNLRSELDSIDAVLMEYFEKRCEIAAKIALYKLENSLPVKDAMREQEVIKKRLLHIKNKNFEPQACYFVKNLMEQSRKVQAQLLKERNGETNSGNIFIVGLPGCGKSIVGQNLAEEADMNFIDLDVYIEEKECKSIADIFIDGEQHFRDIESKYLKELAAAVKNTVIATGGGIVEKDENIKLLKNYKVVYIYRPISMILNSVSMQDRPLLKNDPTKIYELEKRRRPKYEDIATYKVGNFGRVEKTVAKILNLINQKD